LIALGVAQRCSAASLIAGLSRILAKISRNASA
jgi:hypothetical protein